MEYLIRLWGHCQTGRRGQVWPNADSAYVEAVAGWKGKPGAFFKAAVQCRWIARAPHGIEIRGWEEHNRSVLRAWMNGEKGGHPKLQNNTLPLALSEHSVNPTVNPTVTHGLPTGNPLDKPEQPTGNPENFWDGSGTDQVLYKGGSAPLKPPDKKKGSKTSIKKSTVQWAALKARIAELEKIESLQRTPEERAELQECCRKKTELEARQREGRFE